MEYNSEQLLALVLPRLRSYRERPDWNIELVATVTGSTTSTVRAWLSNQPPEGERLIRLWHLLAALGLESSELSDLPGFNRYCGELLTFGVITMKEAQEICNVAKSQSVLLMLRGKTPLRPQYDLAELRELHEDDLRTRRDQVMSVTTPEPDLETVEPPDEAPTTPAGRKGGNHLIVYTASMLKGVLPLVRQLDSESCTPADRSMLRELVGGEDMFDLSNILNRLCSERARNHGRTGQ